VKHFHILVTEFLPDNPTKRERICAPGLLMVHAQVLVNLDSTIHRHANAEASARGASSLTFDELLDPDATLPITPRPNASRLMAENRLIMLLRDFLSDRHSQYSDARHLFAQSFDNILKAAARKTSVYDHNACYTLLDFLEEAMAILVRYDEHISVAPDTVFDWSFWLICWRKMTESHNTTTEIRLFAFLYSTWGVITTVSGKHNELCIGLLLQPDFFQARFCHWCPMVRAYFMRLLVWRMARYDGVGSGDDVYVEFPHCRNYANLIAALSSKH